MWATSQRKAEMANGICGPPAGFFSYAGWLDVTEWLYRSSSKQPRVNANGNGPGSLVR
jgi:hypothetical protein